jgi:AraC-like DNA-binding protein
MTAVLPASTQRFSTAAFEPRERVAVWRELYGRTIARLDIEPPADGEMMVDATLRKLPGLELVSMTSTELRFRKPRNLISSDDVILTIVDTGHWAGSQLGREARLDAGDAVLCTSCEVVAATSFGRRVMVRVPAKTIAPMLADVSAKFSRRIPRETEGLQLLRHYLRVLQDSDQLTKPGFQHLAVTHVYDLLAMTFGATGDATAAVEDRGARAGRLRAIKNDIAQNLEHGDISLAAIAARHRVSPRYLQKLFDSEGTTFSKYALDQRLALAHRLLSDPRRSAEKIATIAFAAGFGDVSYFYRAFRRRYDMLPSDLRAAARRDH